MGEFIKIKDRDTILEISYKDMIKYHGRFNIGGVALAYKSLELGLQMLLPGGEVPMRHLISYNSALGPTATGVVDGIEMASRAQSRGMLSTDMNVAKDIEAPHNPDGGKFYFEVEYDGRKVGLALKDGLIPAEFTSLLQIVEKRPFTNDEAKRLQEVKEEIAAGIMAIPAADLFNMHYL